jgi:uncharacterized repeat protein (TIGR01451 family)
MRIGKLSACLAATGILLTACGGGGGDAPAPTQPRVDVAATVAAPAGSMASGGTLTFSVVVTNAGPDAASDVSIRLSFGDSPPVLGMTCTAAGGAVCPPQLSGSMAVPSLPAGGTLTFAVPVTTTVGFSGLVPLSALVTAANDTQASNNNASGFATVYSADVAVAVTAPTTSVAAGSTATFTAVVSNAGPDAARDVAFAAAPGSGLTLGAVSCSAAGGATCPSALGGSVAIPALPSGGTLTFTLPATVTAGTNGPITLTASVSSAGDPQAANNNATGTATAYSANVSASITTAATVVSGRTANFTGTIANSGPAVAQSVAVAISASGGYSIGTIACSAAGGAICPSPTGTNIVVPQLPVGGTLTLGIPVAVPAAATGNLTASLTVSSAGDPAGGNDSASATTTIVPPDARNGAYYAYATDGRLYSLVLDFNALSYSMSGNGLAAGGSFTADPSGGGYTIGGNARFRVQPDLIVGGFDFGGGVKPFVAARSFVADLSALAGTDFNTLGVNSPVGSGSSDSRIFAARWGTSTVAFCVDNVIYTLAACPAASVWTYNITATGLDNEFTGFDPVHNDTIVFRVAKSGTESVYIRVGTTADGTTRQFRIGVPNASGLTAASTSGAASDGSWSAITLTNTVYAFSGQSASGAATSDTAALSSIVPGPTGIRVGTLVGASASIFVIQNSLMSVAVGARGGPRAGYMQIGTQ